MTNLRISLPGKSRQAAALALFGALAVAGLLWAKWLPYGSLVGELGATSEWSGTGLLETGQDSVQGPSLRAGWEFLLNYGVAILPALVVALVIGASLEALVPASWLGRTLNVRPGLAGALCALPSMMCTCCTAPVVASLRARGVNTRAATAYWLGNPVLNPAVLTFLVLVAPWPWAATRLAVGVLLIACVTVLLRRFAPGRQESARAAAALPSDPVSEQSALHRFGLAMRRFALLVVPEYVIVVFTVGALRGWLFPMTSGATSTVALALLIAVVLGTLVVLPTGGEIPILLALFAAGASPLVIGTLLITLPAVSLPSMVMVGRALTWRVTLTAACCTAGAGLVAGLALLATG